MENITIEDQTANLEPLFDEQRQTKADLTGEQPERSEDQEALPETQAPKEEPRDTDEPNNIEPLEELELALEECKTTAYDDKHFKDFEILSTSDFNELVEDDVEEALIYQSQLSKFREWEGNKRRQEQLATSITENADRVIERSYKKMVDAVPGLHEKNNPISKELSGFAIDHGFEAKFLAAMTNPATTFTPVGSKRAYVLGDGAASLVKMIHSLYQKGKGVKETIGQVPEGKVLSEADMGKISPEDKERYLRGA